VYGSIAFVGTTFEPGGLPGVTAGMHGADCGSASADGPMGVSVIAAGQLQPATGLFAVLNVNVVASAQFGAP
jgi:hypothetical protein